MYRDPTDGFLPVSSCSICFAVLLELGRGNGKNGRHCGSYLHIATISCLYLNVAKLNEKSNGNWGVVKIKMGKKSAMNKWINVCLFNVNDHGISEKGK